jgi:predicted amidophosphoribosyltransferase
MLSDTDRMTNIQGAFAPRRFVKIAVSRILIVDDVWTTGATLREAANCIQRHFGVAVDGAVVARAVGDHQAT